MTLRILVFSTILLLFGGCNVNVDGVPHKIDLKSFSWMGTTFFSDPPQVSMKEVHLESTLLLGRDVIVQGKVVELGDFSTYIVVADNSARMLVVLTELGEMQLKAGDVGRTEVKVLGSVNNGKKGLPYIQARAYTKVNIAENG